MGLNALKTIESPLGAEIVLDGRRYINFGGSSYLGLAGKQEIIDAGIRALRSCGAGYQFARHYRIASGPHQEVELEIAKFYGTETGLFLNGGYSFGLVTIAALRKKYKVIFYDELAHHCLQEAIAASGAESHAFRHLDAGDLEAKLKKQQRADDRLLVVTDGMYSTFGEIAPLDQLASVIRPYGGRLLVDESHSFGVLGKTGRGAHEHHGLPVNSVVIGGSTGKAFGVLGGIIPASEEGVADFRTAPASRGATVGQPAAAAMCATSLRYVREHPELLLRLRANTAYMKEGLRKIGLNVGDSIVPVATFEAGRDRQMHLLQQQLMSEGIYVLHSNYIGAGVKGVIRCGIFADHTNAHIDSLVDALRRLL